MKTTTRSLKRPSSPFRFTIEIHDGHLRSRRSRRELSYPKPPQRWTGVDLLNVLRAMARLASEVRRRKIAEPEMYVTFQARDGGTEVSVKPTFGTWATLPGRSGVRIPPAAIAGVVGTSRICYDAAMRMPAVLPIDKQALGRRNASMLRTLAAMQANIRAGIAGGAR